MTGLPDSLKLQAPAVPSLFSEHALGFATLSVQSVRSVRSVDREPHTPDFLKIFSLKTFLRLKNFVRMVLLEFVNNEAVIMEILYRIFTWLILATVLLLVMPIFLIVIGIIGEPLLESVLTAIILLAIYFLLIYFAVRTTILHDAPAEPRQTSRAQSLMIWLSVIIVITTWMKVLFRIWPVYLFGFNLFYPAAVLPAGGLLCVFYRPFLRHKSGKLFGIIGLLASTLLFLGVDNIAPYNYTFTGESLPVGYPMPVPMRERFFPEGARDFKIEGTLFFINNCAEWSCTVSEKDFERFRQTRGYHFVVNRTDVNEDKNMFPLVYHDSDKWKKPYYFHNNRHANGGGLTLRYSVPERRLYGFYSNR